MSESKRKFEELPSFHEASNSSPQYQNVVLPPIVDPNEKPNGNTNINGNADPSYFHAMAPKPSMAQPVAPQLTQGSPSEDLVAAEALTRLTSTPPPMTPPPMNISTPMSNLSIDEAQAAQHPLIAKVNQVSQIPIVRDAFKYYENSKRNYPHFNFAAGMVERAALPVVNKIEVNLNNRHRERLAVKKKKKRKIARPDKNETKKKLQFCLHLLKLANEQINNQVTFFSNKISEREMKLKEQHDKEAAELAQQRETFGENDITQIPSAEDTKVAQEAKSEIVTTVKKIVHVISNFKTSALSSEANTESSNELRSTIRDIILKLPNQVQQTAINNNTSGPQANEKIFVFAKESLDMISRLTNVFNEQLEKAENWIGDVDSASQNTSRIGSRSQSPFQQSSIENGGAPPPPYEANGNTFSDNKIQS